MFSMVGHDGCWSRCYLSNSYVFWKLIFISLENWSKYSSYSSFYTIFFIQKGKFTKPLTPQILKYFAKKIFKKKCGIYFALNVTWVPVLRNVMPTDLAEMFNELNENDAFHQVENLIRSVRVKYTGIFWRKTCCNCT